MIQKSGQVLWVIEIELKTYKYMTLCTEENPQPGSPAQLRIFGMLVGRKSAEKNKIIDEKISFSNIRSERSILIVLT